jgi:pre-mRNA-splicing factor RBM22/SLT11
MPPPQIKHDLNRSGWESTDFPSICERCLPDKNYVQMQKDEYGAACKICSRPFTVFLFKPDRTARQKRTGICLTCARLKNCCQVCLLDLTYGLSIPVRDAALKLIAPGPQSDINKQFYAQEHEKEIEEGRGPLEAYDKQDEKARDLLRRLANSEPYYKKQRRLQMEGEDEEDSSSPPKLLPAPESSNAVGPVRTKVTQVARHKPYPSPSQLPPRQEDITPPSDPNIQSLLVTGVEDDLPEHALRTFFTKFGPLRSLICSHRSHAAYVNYAKRADAEAAALACQGRAIIQGVPLRVQWGKPKPLDTQSNEERLSNAKEGRTAFRTGKGKRATDGTAVSGIEEQQPLEDIVVAPPPGQGEIAYESLAGS